MTKNFRKVSRGGGTPNKENFLRKRWFFWALPWTKSQEKLSTDRLVLLVLFVPCKLMWFPRNGISCLFSELSYLTSISLKCKLCPMQSYDPWQVLTFATSGKVLLTSSCLSTHRCACACTCAHNPKISSLADLGKRKFSDVFTQRKSRVREFKEFSGRLVPMYPAYQD